MRLAKRPIVHEHADAAIRFFGNLPGSLGTFERVAELGGSSCGSEEPNSETERKRDISWNNDLRLIFSAGPMASRIHQGSSTNQKENLICKAKKSAKNQER